MNQRFTALDIFRGMTIALMIVVNTPGDWGQTFAPLLHADWHGFSPTDLVFPSFLFAVGTSLAFVIGKWRERPFQAFLSKVLRRFLLLFAIGYFLSWFPFVRWAAEGGLEPKLWSHTRIWGVLQRIALAYALGALLVYRLNTRQVWIVSAACLLAYWGIMYAFGDYSLPDNAVRRLDLFLFGSSHLYKGDGIPFDPEGLLSTLPALVNVLGGYLLGVFVKEKGVTYETLAKLALVGATLLFGAYAWDMAFPINKKIWTSSYVLLTVGLDLMVVAGIMYLTDFAKPAWQGRFFQTFGKNPLATYLLSVFLVKIMLFIRIDGDMLAYRWLYLRGFDWLGPYWGSLAFALTIMVICWGFAKILENRGIIVKI